MYMEQAAIAQAAGGTAASQTIVKSRPRIYRQVSDVTCIFLTTNHSEAARNSLLLDAQQVPKH